MNIYHNHLLPCLLAGWLAGWLVGWLAGWKRKVAGLRTATLLKMRLWHRCFPVNFAKFLRTPIFTEHHWTAASKAYGLPLDISSISSVDSVFLFEIYS